MCMCNPVLSQMPCGRYDAIVSFSRWRAISFECWASQGRTWWCFVVYNIIYNSGLGEVLSQRGPDYIHEATRTLHPHKITRSQLCGAVPCHLTFHDRNPAHLCTPRLGELHGDATSPNGLQKLGQIAVLQQPLATGGSGPMAHRTLQPLGARAWIVPQP